MQYYDLDKEAAAGLTGTDLTPPPIDFKALAEAVGLAAWRVENPDHLSETLKSALAVDGPSLVDVVLDAPMEEFGT